MSDTDKLRPEVQIAMRELREALRAQGVGSHGPQFTSIRAELVRLADENARLNKFESQATEQRLQMEDVELYLMDVSQPDDEDADWCDRMKSAIEGLVNDCNQATGLKNQSIRRTEKVEAELAALKARIAGSSVVKIANYGDPFIVLPDHFTVPNSLKGKTVRLVVEE